MAVVFEPKKQHIHAMELVDRVWAVWISTSWDDFELKRIQIDDILREESPEKLEKMLFILEQKRKKLERDLIITKAVKTVVADTLDITNEMLKSDLKSEQPD